MGQDGCPWFFQVSCRWPALWPDANFGEVESFCVIWCLSRKIGSNRDIKTVDELERGLSDEGKDDIVAVIHGFIPDHVNCILIRQPRALGL